MNDSLKACFVIAAGLLLTTGCGKLGQWSESRQVMLYPVSGVVTLDGEPIDGAQVLLQPEEEAKQSLIGMGETDASGRFSIVTVQAGEGAIAGPHKVRVVKTIVTDDRTGFDPEAYVPPVIEKNVLPAKYDSFEKSGLSVAVSDTQATYATIELDSKAK
ncbi:MAG: hypothetical protein ACIALR_17300 [Blastopirellula sp. JB062]